MPIKRVNKKTYKKRPGKKRQFKRRTNVTKSLAPLVPLTKVGKMRCSINYSIAIPGGPGGPTMKTIAIGDIIRPDPASAHRAIGSNQMLALYKYFCVVGAKAFIRAHPAYTNDPSKVGFMWGAYISEYTNIPNSVENIIEAKRGRYKVMGSEPNSPQTISLNYGLKKFYKITNVKDNLNIYGGEENVAPIKTPFLQTWAAGGVGSTAETPMNFYVTIEFIVLWYGRRELTGSQ